MTERSTGRINQDQVRLAAEGVPDPEIRLTLGELDMIDEVLIDENGDVLIRYHLTSPLCPSPFAVQIGLEVRRRVEQVKGVRRCRVDIRDHFIAHDISTLVNDSEVGPEPSWL